MSRPLHPFRAVILAAALAATSLSAFSADAPASFHPGEIWLDDKGVAINAHGGGMLYHDGTYYWFGEHKIAGSAGNVAHVGVHVYSSSDLYHWKDEGIALPVSADPASEIAEGCIIERPKVLYNAATKKFVMWFHLELKGQDYSSARCGVATSDQPTGPYTYIGSQRLDPGAWPLNIAEGDRPELVKRDFTEGQMSRDMTLFQDDDGTGYVIATSEDNIATHICRLSRDYLSTDGPWTRAFAWRTEAPAVFKYNGKYYLIGSHLSYWAPNPAISAVANSMLGRWTDLGNPCRGANQEVAVTFHSQSNYVLPVAGRKGAFIFMADRWNPENAIDGRYVWLPIKFESDTPVLKWHDQWDLSVFDKR